MPIIKHISLNKTRNSDNITIRMDRSFPATYSPTDEFTLEKYELDLNDLETRLELKNAIKSQTVIQYMMNEMFMSSSFFLVPVVFTGPSQERVYLEKYANFSKAPIFVNITDTIKAQNIFYVDKLSFKSTYLYLYRIVYKYGASVYNTNYVAGFDTIESTGVQEGKYKPAILNGTLERMFGPNWANIKHYFSTESSETRTQYRQTSTVFKVPMRKSNHRKQGPLEDYKLKLDYKEASKRVTDIEIISQKVKDELVTQIDIFKRFNINNINFTSTFGKDLDKYVSDIEAIARDTIFSITEKTSSIFRVLSKSLKGKDQYNIPIFMVKEGIYILLSSTEYARTLYDYLTTINPESVYGIIDDIYIADVINQTILYTIHAGK